MGTVPKARVIRANPRFRQYQQFPLQTKPKLRILYTLLLQIHIYGEISCPTIY